MIKAIPEDTMYLLDGPGTNSSTDVSKHAVLISKLFTTFKLSTIFVVVPFENRFDTMSQKYHDTIKQLLLLDEIRDSDWKEKEKALIKNRDTRQSYDQDNKMIVTDEIKKTTFAAW